jgi:hypothetical protein
MARTTGVSRKTIRKILCGQRHDTFRTRQSSLDAWSLILEAEWNAGCEIAAELWRRLKASGFGRSIRVVSERATRRRRDEKLGHAGGAGLSARTIARSLPAAVIPLALGVFGSGMTVGNLLGGPLVVMTVLATHGGDHPAGDRDR